MLKYSEDIMQRCRQRLDLDEDDDSEDDKINGWSKRKVFDECLKWEGIINYTDWIIDLFQELSGETL